LEDERCNRLSCFKPLGNNWTNEEKGIDGGAFVAALHLGGFTAFDYENLKINPWLGFSIEGDEALEGPVFNYARFFTFREFSSTITNAFAANLASLKTNNTRRNDIFEVAESCKLDKRFIQAYTPWLRIDPTVWHQMLLASGAAIFVQ
jgi:hypothetical protein